MKKLFKGLVALVVVLTLSGCTSSTVNQDSQLDVASEVVSDVIVESSEVASDVIVETIEVEEVGVITSVFELNIDGYYSKIVIEHDGTNLFTFESYEINEYGDMNKEEAIAWYPDATDTYKGLAGYTYEIEFGEESYSEHLRIDYTNPNFDHSLDSSNGPTTFNDHRNIIMSGGYTEM